METWKTLLRADPTDWLLDTDDPAIRYTVLREVLGAGEQDREALQAKAEIHQRGLVPRILAKQNPGGFWGKREDFYVRSKYKGTVWSLILLAHLGADASHPQIRETGEFVLEAIRHFASGGFSVYGQEGQGGRADAVIPCLSGNMVWSLLRVGFAGDPRLQQGVDWITTYQRFDDGDGAAPRGWPYADQPNCWGRHTCMMGVVKTLKALAALPKEMYSEAVIATITRAKEYILRHRLVFRSHDTEQPANLHWLSLRYPRMAYTDLLEMLEVLTDLDCSDLRMQPALDLLLAKQDESGRWSLEDSYNGRMRVRLEQEGQPSRWITLKSMKVLRRFGSSLVSTVN